jgi:uncharacterized membrane protein YebE (DUF533 family)
VPLLSILAGDYDDALLGRSLMRRARGVHYPIPSALRRKVFAAQKGQAVGPRRFHSPSPNFGHSPLFGAEDFQSSGTLLGDGAELLGRSFLKRMASKTKKAVTGAAKFAARNPLLTVVATGGVAAPILLTTKKGRQTLAKTAGNVAAYGLAPTTGGLSLLGKKSVRKFAQRHPFMTAAVNPASLAYTLATKKGRTKALNTTGNVLAYGLAPMTGGASLLGKKKIRKFVGRQVDTAGHYAANVGRGVGHFVAQTASQIIKQEQGPEGIQDSGSGTDSAPKKKSSFVLPVGIGAALLAFL